MPTNIPELPQVTSLDDLIKQNEAQLRQRLGLNPLNAQDYLIRDKVDQGYLPEGMEETFKGFMDQSPDPTEALAKLNSAKFYSDAMGIPLQSAIENHDIIAKEWWGQARTPISGWQAIQESFQSGMLSVQLGNLYADSMDGMTPELQAQIDALEEQMPSPDKFQRTLPIQMLKGAASSLPYTVMAGAGQLAT